MPSLFDNLLAGALLPQSGGIEGIRALLGKSSASRSGQNDSMSPASGLPEAFSPDAMTVGGGSGMQRPPVHASVEPLRAPDLGLNQMSDDAQRQAVALLGARRKPVVDPNLPQMPTSTLLEKLAALLREGGGDDSSDEGTQGDLPISGPRAPTKRVMSPMEGPDTGEELPDMPGVPRGYFSRVLGPESSGRMDAINPTSKAVGLYQFLPSTLSMLKQMNPDLKIDANWRKDRAQQDGWMRAYTQLSLDALKPLLGDKAPTYGDLYAMHFFGQKGGAGLITNKDKKLGELLPDIVFKWNPRLNRNQTAAEFIDAINKAWGEP